MTDYGEYNEKIKLIEDIKKNVLISVSSFEKCNLRPLRYCIEPCTSCDDYDFYLQIEVEAVGNAPILSCDLKANIYNEMGELLTSGSKHISSENFLGYNTVVLSLYHMKRALLETRCIRIYCA